MSTPPSYPYYDRLGKAIAVYEGIVSDVLKSLCGRFVWDLATVVVIPAVLAIIAQLFSSVAGMLTTLGVGGLNFIERLRRGETALKSFWGDRSKLKRTVQTLKLRYALCAPSDNVKLKEVEDLMMSYFQALPR